MPAYGVEKFISTAIESIINQSYQDWELIVVNDGTKDRSAEIAREYAASNPKIRVVDKPNGGLSSARNFGLQFASGKYVTFFDSDDRAEPDFLENLISKDKEDPDVIIGGYKVVYELPDGSEKLEVRNCPTDGSFNGNATRFVCYAWNKLFRLDFLKKNNLLYEEGLYRIEDAEFMSRLIRHNPKVAFVENCNYLYVQRNVATLSTVIDSNIVTHAVRRVNIDADLLSFFSKEVTDREELIERLKLNSSYNSLSRILFHSKAPFKQKRALLKQLKKDQKPKRIPWDFSSPKRALQTLLLKFL